MKKTLIKLFKRTPTIHNSNVNDRPTPSADQDGFITPKKASELLADERRQILLDRIWEQTSVSRESFNRLYQEPIDRYAELVQELPASENHHHSYLGGMLDHGLELVLYALRIRQGYLLPIGASPEEQAQHAGIWTAGVAYGALMHDTGKITCDIRVQTSDGQPWHAWHGPITQPYRFQYIKGRDYKLHNAAATLLCPQILGSEILNWLAKNPSLWASLLYLLSGDYAGAGVLAEIVSKADRTSTAMNIGANPEKAMQAPPESLQAHLARGLRELFASEEHKLKINVPGAAGWLTQDGLWLVSKVVADKLRAFLLAQGVDKVPSKNSALFDELQSHRLIEPNSEGNAIWQATVTDGSWQQGFTFLRVKPALIWGNGEYPAVFKGSVTYEDHGTATSETTKPQQRNEEAPENALTSSDPQTITHSSETGKTGVHTTQSQAHQPGLEPTDDGIDDVLALLDIPDSVPQPLEQADTKEAQFNPASAQATRECLATAEPRSSMTVPQPPKPAPQTAYDAINSKSDQALQRNNAYVAKDAPTLETLGQAFIDWLKQAIEKREIYINDSKAPLHIVDGKVFMVTPTIFQRYLGQFPEVQQLHTDDDGKPWRVVQRQFERMQLHIKRGDDLNIFQCTVRGPRKSGNVINGYMLPTQLLFASQPHDNPFVVLKPDK